MAKQAGERGAETFHREIFGDWSGKTWQGIKGKKMENAEEKDFFFFSLSTKMEISTGKKLKSHREKSEIGKSDLTLDYT